jgi:hypothetical protein
MQLFVDNQGQQFIKDMSGPVPLGVVPLPQNNDDVLDIYLLNRPASTGLPMIAATIPAPFTGMIIGFKSNLAQTEFLCSCSEFTELIDGNGNPYYEGNFDIDTAPMQAAIAGLTVLRGYIEVDLVAADATRLRNLTPGAVATVIGAVYQGTEGVPESGDPNYPLPGNLLTTGADTGNIKRVSTAIPAGADTVGVAFATPFAAAPDTILNTVVKANPGDVNAVAVTVDSVTQYGFNCNLSGPAPAGATLMSCAFLSGGVIEGIDTPTWKRLQVAIPAGAESVAVGFATAFQAAPSSVLCNVKKANPGDANAGVASIDSVTANGFNANLSGAAPAGSTLMVTALL